MSADVVSAAVFKSWHPLESSRDANLIMAAQPVARKEQTVSRSQNSAIADDQNSATVDEVLALVLDTAESILGKPVQPSHNFFELGGDSMRAVEMINTLEDRLGAEFDPTSIIDAEDMAALAMSLQNQLWES
jgi:acyl carrier protein